MKITLGLILFMVFITFASLKKTKTKNASKMTSKTETTSDSIVTVGSSQASTESSQGSTTIATSRKAKRKKSGSKETAMSGKSTTKKEKIDFNVPYGKYGLPSKNFLGDDEKYEDEKSSARGKARRWPNNTLPYKLEKGKFNSTEIKYIEKAMHNISKVTKVKFVKYTNQKGYFNITKKENKGCYSTVGYNTGWSEVNLPAWCIPTWDYIPGPLSPSRVEETGGVMHELLHTLGIEHEQVRPDRDKYIIVNWKNIQKGSVDIMKPLSKANTDTLGLGYGYDSIMHYDPYSYAINSSIPTMIPRDKKSKLGSLKVLTPYDIKRINLMYP